MTSVWDQAEPPRRTTPAARGPVVRTRQDRQRFADRLLAKLPGPHEEPVSTTDLGDYYQLDAYERAELLWTLLDRQARSGLVERVIRDGDHVRYWRRTPAGDQQVRDAGGPQTRSDGTP